MISLFDKIRFRLQDHCESGDCRKFCHECDFKTALRIVDEVEAEYGDGWVSCSKRLPEENGRYITTNMYEGEKEEVFDMWYEDGKWSVDAGADETIRIVLAWKPLPEPYKPEKGE